MTATLATCSDPAELVAGDPLTAEAIAEDLRVRGVALDSIARSLADLDPADAWRSDAGDALRPTVARLAEHLGEASEAHQRASVAVEDYAGQVRTARSLAAQAVETWQRGERASAAALADRTALVRRVQVDATLGETTPVLPGFVDPGQVARQDAEALLAAARRTSTEAGDEAAQVVQGAADGAPDGPGFWDQVGDLWSEAWHGAGDLGADIGNGLLSFGNALVQHPDLMVELVGGLLLMQGGAAMEVGGVALDLTVVGAPAGVALNITGAGVIAAGAGLAGQAALRAGIEAAGDDAIRPLEGPGRSSGSGYRSPDAVPEDFPTSVNGYRGHALERLEERGIERWKVDELVENPPSEPVWQADRQTWLYESDDLEVAVNELGEVVTAYIP